jgi:hypothetical protein
MGDAIPRAVVQVGAKRSMVVCARAAGHGFAPLPGAFAGGVAPEGAAEFPAPDEVPLRPVPLPAPLPVPPGVAGVLPPGPPGAVAVTLAAGGLALALQSGAKEWREADEREQAAHASADARVRQALIEPDCVRQALIAPDCVRQALIARVRPAPISSECA